ncbi:MAG: alpha/beta fold hydrolase [Marinobacter sp.]|uniref:alpha/beta hydrolase n=1 Tax=Marinobacter sp. TaxID=50741 RepID=UPI00299F0D85|nr:alpha/beta fold hydrolase [Marinobacter sp.]MDX1635151.1 alpha/beta fold hydrolase [Marinobacter sp.]
MATGTARLLLTPMLLAALLTQAGCSNLFFYPNELTYITPDRLNLAYEDVYLDTPDDETLHAWWLPAEGEPKGQVYFLHGNAQNISSHILNVAWLPPAGYSVFLIDYRGYGKSTGEPDLEGALTDAEAGLRWLLQKKHAQGQPLFILGQSLGGALAIPLAHEWQQRDLEPELDGVILDAAFSGFREIAREKLSNFWLTWPLQIPLSWTIPDDYEGSNLIAGISPTPVMVIHSTRDGIIPFHHGRELFQAAEEPKRFLETDTPHASTFVIPAYQKAVLEFMRESAGKSQSD